MTTLQVSVIIPCYNNERFVHAAITSALNQNYIEYEVIVIDDGSTDSSLEIIQSFGEQIRWESGMNRGAPIARNRGLELARSEYIKFLDADDILLPDCLARQMTQTSLLSVNEKAIVYGDAIWINEEGQPLPGYSHQSRQTHEESLAHILAHSPLISCPLHRRDYLLEIGGFDPSLPKGQEQDLHMRLVLAGVDFIHHPGPVFQYREYQDSQRVSQRGLMHKGPMVHYQILQRQQQLIETTTGQMLSLTVRKLFAQRYWAYGRSILRAGYHNEATHYFHAAKTLDRNHCVVGRLPYPALVKLFGPYQAENYMEKLHKLFQTKLSRLHSA